MLTWCTVQLSNILNTLQKDKQNIYSQKIAIFSNIILRFIKSYYTGIAQSKIL